MATEQTVNAALSRLSVNFRIERTEEETAVVLIDWVRALGGFDDEVVRMAVDVWVLSEDRFPPLSRMLDTVQNEARLLLRARNEARFLLRVEEHEPPRRSRSRGDNQARERLRGNRARDARRPRSRSSQRSGELSGLYEGARVSGARRT